MKRNRKDISSPLEVDSSYNTLKKEFKNGGKGLVRVQKFGISLSFLPFQVSNGQKNLYMNSNNRTGPLLPCLASWHLSELRLLSSLKNINLLILN